MSFVDEASPYFKSLVWDILVKKAVADAIALLAISPTGWLGVLVTKIILKFTDWLYPVLEKVLVVGEIKLRNTVHQKLYEREQYRLRVIAIEKGLESKEFKSEREIAHNKLANAIVYNIKL